jgi:hypothetical protein
MGAAGASFIATAISLSCAASARVPLLVRRLIVYRSSIASPRRQENIMSCDLVSIVGHVDGRPSLKTEWWGERAVVSFPLAIDDGDANGRTCITAVLKKPRPTLVKRIVSGMPVLVTGEISKQGECESLMVHELTLLATNSTRRGAR